MEEKDSIRIKSAETDEELRGRGYVHCTSWQEAYRGIVSDTYLDSMTVEATTARARQFPENTLVAKDDGKVVGFAVYGPSRDEDLTNAGEIIAIYGDKGTVLLSFTELFNISLIGSSEP